MNGIRWFAFAVLLSIASARAADSQPINGKVVVVLQGFAPGCEECGLLVGGLIALEDRARAKEMRRLNEAIHEAMPGLDIPSLIQASFCREIFEMDGQCDRVVVIGKGGKNGTIAGLSVESNDIVVKVAVEFPRNDFRVIGAVSPVSTKGEVESAAVFAWYVTPPASKLDASPFDVVTKRNESKVAAAKKYWLSGEPSILRQELMRSFGEVADIISASTIALPQDAASKSWWMSLPVIKALVAAGNFKCKGFPCSLRYVGVPTDRIWHAQNVGDIVIVSYPIAALAK
jgi:hypothetical protein